jgi:hypothetical protein
MPVAATFYFLDLEGFVWQQELYCSMFHASFYLKGML